MSQQKSMFLGFMMGMVVTGVGVSAYMMMRQPPPAAASAPEASLAKAPAAAADPEQWFEEFRQPESRSSRMGVLDTSLTAQFSEVRLRFDDAAEETFYARVYDDMVPGPTLRALPGDQVRVLFHNNLIDPRVNPPDDDAKFQLTNLHTHGWHVDPGSVVEDGKVVLAHDDVLVTILPPAWQPSHGSHEGHEIDPSDPSVIKEMLQYEYDIPVYHAPGTHWYHAHRHGSVSKQTENGMAGALIIDEPPGQEIMRGVKEKIIIIQDISNILVEESGGGQKMELGEERTTINGVYRPTLRMNPGEVQRWRVINAGSNTRAFNELFVRPAANNRGKNLNFFVVARDGVTLKEIEPVQVGTSLFMGPGNRLDLLVTSPTLDPASYQAPLKYVVGSNKDGLLVGTVGYTNEAMTTLPTRQAPPLYSSGKVAKGEPPPVTGTRPVFYAYNSDKQEYQYKVPKLQKEVPLGFVEVAGLPMTHQKLPDQLPPPPPGADYLNDIGDDEINDPGQLRTIVFDVTFENTGENGSIDSSTKRLLVNGQQFDDENAMQIDVTAGSVEEWTLINNADQSHPFHIHVNPFQIVEIKQWQGYQNDDPAMPVFLTPDWAPRPGTWLDTITVPPRGWVKFRSRFPGRVSYQGNEYNFAGSYVLHCHILNHEDGGMMIQVNVNPPGA